MVRGRETRAQRASTIDESLNIVTWNIREFGKKARSEAAIHYFAEILGQFNLVVPHTSSEAIQ
jgi:hypothetical protein